MPFERVEVKDKNQLKELLIREVPEDLQRIVSHLDVQIDLYEWEYLKLDDQCGLYLKPASLRISEEQRLWTRLKTQLLEYSRKPSAETKSRAEARPKAASTPDEEAMEVQPPSRIRVLKRPSRLFGKNRGLRHAADREAPQRLEQAEAL